MSYRDILYQLTPPTNGSFLEQLKGMFQSIQGILHSRDYSCDYRPHDTTTFVGTCQETRFQNHVPCQDVPPLYLQNTCKVSCQQNTLQYDRIFCNHHDVICKCQSPNTET